MRYSEVVTRELEVTGNWDNDVQNLLSVSLHVNHNNVERSMVWLGRIEATSIYEDALKREALNRLSGKTKTEQKPDLEQPFWPVFGDILKALAVATAMSDE